MLLLIAPPPVADLPEAERRPMALFFVWRQPCIISKKRPAFCVHTPGKKGTLWLVPQAQTLSCNPAVSWGRSAACPALSVTSSFARGQHEPLLCRQRAIKKKTHTSFELKRPKYLHDLANLAATILGESTVGSHV